MNCLRLVESLSGFYAWVWDWKGGSCVLMVVVFVSRLVPSSSKNDVDWWVGGGRMLCLRGRDLLRHINFRGRQHIGMLIIECWGWGRGIETRKAY